jgi:hypothetical protein
VALAEKNWIEAAGTQLLGAIGASRSSRKKVLGSTCQAEQSQGQPVALLDSQDNKKGNDEQNTYFQGPGTCQ